MFIRTKDGTIYGNGGFILEIEKLNLNKIVGNIKYEIIDNKLIKTMYGYEAHIFEYDIINQSDNLAELCDVVVIKRTNKDTNIAWYVDYPMEYYQDVMIDSRLDYIKIDYIKFGIWNDDKGLIYVAKMDNDGKLVLL